MKMKCVGCKVFSDENIQCVNTRASSQRKEILCRVLEGQNVIWISTLDTQDRG